MSRVCCLLVAIIYGLMFPNTFAWSAPPDLKTPAPVIYLADNLDEKDRLGFCIDTVGRGLSDRLHAHSCKPQGGDVQFQFDTANGQIRSATFDNKCAALMEAPAPGVKLALLDCADGDEQRFTFATDNGEFHPAGRNDMCLAVGPASRTAGPFMSRDLMLADCASTDAGLKRWIVADTD